MELYPDINEKLTIKRVNKFLTDDLARLLLLSGHSLKDLRDNLTYNGNYLICGVDADAMVVAVSKTIKGLSDSSQRIITYTYIKQMSSRGVAKRIGYSHTRYHELKNKALLEFADNFTEYLIFYNCRPHIDLHIYK